MRAFLDPGWKREFGPSREAESLPKAPPGGGATASVADEQREGISQRLALLADPQKAAAAAKRPLRPPAAPSKQPIDPSKRAALGEARRELWKAQIKAWMRQHDRGADWELPKADEKVLFEWFEAIDIDRSGAIDASEIRALLAANAVGCSPARIEALFAIAGKQPHDELGRHDFVKLMHLGGASALFSSKFDPYAEQEEEAPGAAASNPYGGAYGGGGDGPQSTLSESRSSGDLAVLAYRRQRVLSDLKDPTKRGPFATHDAFLRKYAPGAKKEYLKRWQQNAVTEGETLLPRELSAVETRRAAEGTFLKSLLKSHDDAEFARLAREEAAALAAAERARPLRGSSSLPAIPRGPPRTGPWLSKNKLGLVGMSASVHKAGDAKRKAARQGIAQQSLEYGYAGKLALPNVK